MDPYSFEPPPQPAGLDSGSARKLLRAEVTRIGWGMFLCMLLSNLTASAIYILLGRTAPSLLDSTWTILGVSAVSTYCFGFGPLWLVLRGGDDSDLEGRVSADIAPGRLFRLFCASYALSYLANLLTVTIIEILTDYSQTDYTDPIDTILHTSSSQYALFFFMVVLAPIFEELVFRGLLLCRVRKYGDTFAIVFTSLAFALFHANLSQALYTFVLGAILGYVALRSGAVIYSIVLHAAINGSSVIISNLLTRTDINALSYILLFLLLCMLIGISHTIRSLRSLLLQRSELPLRTGQKVSACLLNHGVLVFFALVAALIVLNNFF